jgi:hypothetical protein
MVRLPILTAVAALTALSAEANASWRCPAFSNAYYPQVLSCPNWQFDPNGPVEQQKAIYDAQRRIAVQKEEARRAEEEARRAAELAKIEADREAVRARTIAAARIAAENSPDNQCREPNFARKLIDAFNDLDWIDRRKAVDIEHLVTLPQGVKCHGVWVLTDGRRIEGTLTIKPNVAGDTIVEFKSEGWTPDILPITTQTPTVLKPAVSVTSSSSPAYRDGANDRLAWESWFNGLSGDERDGAYYWSAQRSLKNPGDCSRLGGVGMTGCLEAQQRLSIRRPPEKRSRLSRWME